MTERSAGAKDGGMRDLGEGPHSLSAKDLLTRTPAEAKRVVVDSYRQAVQSDATAVQAMLSPFTSSLYGSTSPAILIERSTICLSSLSADQELVAFGAFCTYPLQPRASRRVPPARWQSWVREHYSDTERLTPLNTMFCHLLVAKKGFQLGLFNEVINGLFLHMPDVEQIFFTVPEEADVGVALKKLCKGETVQRRESSLEAEKTETELSKIPLLAYPSLLRCLRYDHVPTLHLRSAVQRDSDDVTALFSAQEQEPLREQYGDYFVAEVIKMECDDVVSLVAERYGKVVGFVTATKRVDVESLRQNYQLDIYDNLRARAKRPAPPDTDVSVESSDAISANDSSATSSMPDVMVSAPSPAPDETEQKSASNMSSSKLTGKDSTTGVGSTSTATLKSSLKSGQSGSKLADVTSLKLSSASGVVKSQTKMVKIGSVSKVTFQDVKPEAEEATSSTSSVPAVKSGSSKSMTSSSLESTAENDEEAAPPAGSETSLLPEMLTRDREYDGPLTESVVMAAEEVPNVVCLRLFCMDRQHDSRYLDFIRRLFEIFHDVEYCAVTQVSTTKESPLYKMFTRAERVIGSNIDSDLYLIHRNALLDDYEVDYVKDNEHQEIQDFICDLSPNTGVLIMTDVRYYFDNGCEPEEYGGALMHVVRVKCHGEVVALAVMRDVQDPDWLRAHYDTESMNNWLVLQQEDHKYLNHFVINSGFVSRQRFILGQVMQAAKATSLYYELYEGRIHPTTVQSQRPFTLTPALDLMTIAKTRRQIIYSKDLEVKPSARVLQEKDPATMFYVNRKFLTAVRDVINTRVVVVGASVTGLALLETIATNPYLRFNNLVLIDPHGIPGMTKPECGKDVDEALPHSLWFTPSTLCQSGLSASVTVVRAKMASLNRIRQEVILDNRCRVPYDELVICTGTQYSAVRSVLAVSRKVAGLELKKLEATVERNVISINTVKEADTALEFVRHTLNHTLGQILLYGDSLASYTTIPMLLRYGVTPNRIDLVMPTPASGGPENGGCFQDKFVASEMLRTFQRLGITVRHGEVLHSWDSEPGTSLPKLWVTFTNVQTGTRGQEPADALFYFDKKTVDQDAFLAMNSSRLVFDSRLVIDEHFTSTDPLIRAAGPCTKYQLKLYKDGWTPERYSSRELGGMVANLLLDKYDQNAVEVVTEVKYGHTPWFEDRLSVRALLPGNYTFVRIASPPRMTDANEPGFQDKTISTNTKEGYLKFEFVRGKIATITLFSRQEVEIDNITSLWSYHSNVFRRLLDQHEEHPIENLFSFLRQEWLTVFFHDRFPDVLEEMRAALLHPILEEPGEESKSLSEFAEDMLTITHGQLDKRDMLEMTRRYESTDVVSSMQQLMVNFISKHREQLPMYALPNML